MAQYIEAKPLLALLDKLNGAKMLIKTDDSTFNYLAEIFKHTSQLKRGENKNIQCPICKCSMFIAKAKCNGHIMALCSRKECIKVIQ